MSDQKRKVGMSPLLGMPFDPKNVKPVDYGKVEEKIMALLATPKGEMVAHPDLGESIVNLKDYSKHEEEE